MSTIASSLTTSTSESSGASTPRAAPSTSSSSSASGTLSSICPQFATWLSLIKFDPSNTPPPRRVELLTHLSDLTNTQLRELPSLHNIVKTTLSIPSSTPTFTQPYAVTVLTPGSDMAGPFPLILYIPGTGGYTHTRDSTELLSAYTLAHHTRAIVATFAPHGGAKFPGPLTAVFEVLQHLLTNGSRELGTNGTLILSGTASGAALAASALIRLRELTVGGVREQVGGLLLRCPWGAHPSLLPLEEVQGSVWGTGSVLMDWQEYGVPKEEWESRFVSPGMYSPTMPTSPLASPVEKTDTAPVSWPRTWFQLSTADPCYPQGLSWAQKLRKAGVDVEVNVAEGMPAVWWDLPRMEGARQADVDAARAVEWCIRGSGWDTGIWVEGERTGGRTAWEGGNSTDVKKKLCSVPGCGCWM